MKRFLFTFCLVTLANTSTFASGTGDFGWNIGFGLGIGGIDYKSSSTQVNIGGVASEFDIGIHYSDFAFVLIGDTIGFQGMLENRSTNLGLGFKMVVL